MFETVRDPQASTSFEHAVWFSIHRQLKNSPPTFKYFPRVNMIKSRGDLYCPPNFFYETANEEDQSKARTAMRWRKKNLREHILSGKKLPKGFILPEQTIEAVRKSENGQRLLDTVFVWVSFVHFCTCMFSYMYLNLCHDSTLKWFQIYVLNVQDWFQDICRQDLKSWHDLWSELASIHVRARW